VQGECSWTSTPSSSLPTSDRGPLSGPRFRVDVQDCRSEREAASKGTQAHASGAPGGPEFREDQWDARGPGIAAVTDVVHDPLSLPQPVPKSLNDPPVGLVRDHPG